MRPLPKLLSKTKILRGYQCLKNIYYTIHHPDFEAPIGPEQQAVFDQGSAVGVLARDQFPGGVLVDNLPWDFGGSLKRTKELLKLNTPVIYEAAFEYHGCYARADVICYSADTQRWRVIEVKSTTKMKPEHVDDIGLQAWILAKAGLPIESIHLMHLNPECRYPDLSNLFATQDLTERVREIYPDILPRVSQIFNAIKSDQVPDVDIGPQCLSPYECGFKDHCWKERQIPEFSILNLPGLRDKKWDYYRKGVLQIDDPRFEPSTALQQRILDVAATGKRWMDCEGIRKKISKWKFPLIFLDFETTNPAIPRYSGQAPYGQIPFQYSVHILRAIDAEPEHHEFLHTDLTDPRPEMIPQLLSACGTEGSIVAYYSQFESSRIEEMSAVFPQHKEALLDLLPRMVDPLPIIRDNIYDPAFAGSFSLKAVAPALLGQQSSYEGMSVADGGAAQRAFSELIDANVSAERKEHLRQALLEYCAKDTLVLVDLVKWLYSNCAK